MTEVPGQLVCPACYGDEQVEPAIERPRPYGRTDSTYVCAARGHEFDHPRVHLPNVAVDVERARRARLEGGRSA